MQIVSKSGLIHQSSLSKPPLVHKHFKQKTNARGKPFRQHINDAAACSYQSMPTKKKLPKFCILPNIAQSESKTKRMMRLMVLKVCVLSSASVRLWTVDWLIWLRVVGLPGVFRRCLRGLGVGGWLPPGRPRWFDTQSRWWFRLRQGASD